MVEPTKPARDDIPDLLLRPPMLASRMATPWPHPLVNPVRQLEALAELLQRGLLSRDEFERVKQKVCSD